MKPYQHAKNSAKKYGGVPEDYQAVHDLPQYIVVELPTGKVSYTRNRFFRGGYEPGGFVAFLVLFFIAYMYADVVWRALMWE